MSRSSAFPIATLCASLLAVVFIALPASAVVSIDWITIGDEGNTADGPTGNGAVPYPYRISKFEITMEQYAEFLNAVAASDRPVLGDQSIFEGQPSGGFPAHPITRSGTFGNFTYSVEPGYEQAAFGGASFYDAVRFANWIHNGQPVGDIGPTTTEDGAYTIIQGSAPVRNANALVTIASDDEWFKAAYFDPSTGGYFDYPAGSNIPMTCSSLVVPDPNTANCSDRLHPVGSYTGSSGPYGTFDQAHFGGEWTESVTVFSAFVRGSGSSFTPFHKTTDVVAFALSNEFVDTTFRLTSPVPASVPALGETMLRGLVIVLLATAYFCSRRSRSLVIGASELAFSTRR